MNKLFLLMLLAFASIESFSQPFISITSSIQQMCFAGVDWGDYDNDGDLDVFVSGRIAGAGEVTRIYENKNGIFVATSPTGVGNYGDCDLMWNDYDNDGELDYLLTGTYVSCPTSPLVRNDLLPVGPSQRLAKFTDPQHGLQRLSHASIDFGDYDNDGDQDIVMSGDDANIGLNIYHTIIYKNQGGTFININASLLNVNNSVVRWVDYDNDRDLDLFVAGYDKNNSIAKTFLYTNTNGLFSNSGFSFKNLYDGDADFGDYDNDGDMDLILTGDSVAGYSYTKLYRNDISTFTPMPVALPGASDGSVAWGDYDNDGRLDILISGQDNGLAETDVFRNTGPNSFSQVAIGVPGHKWTKAKWGDYDNDHDLDFILTGAIGISYTTSIYSNQLASGSSNTLPQPPTSLTTSVTTGTVNFNWLKGTDNETPQNGLNYNMYCGISPNGIEVMSPMADLATGYHKEMRVGNVGSVNGWKLSGLTPGTYWWGVQTIDQAFEGSVFSSESTFTVFDSLAPTLYFPYKNMQNVSCNLQAKWFGYTGAVSYQIIVSDTISFSNIVFQNMAVNDTVVVVANLKSNKKYYWKVQANLFAGVSSWSNVWEFNTLPYFTPIVVNDLPGVTLGKSDFGDYDNDGDMDLLLYGVNSGYVTSIYNNTGGNFSDALAGLTPSYNGEACWGDFDNDNDLDLAYTGNGTFLKIYKNNNGVFSPFQNIAALGALAWGDYDNDGDLDLAVVGNQIFRNDGSTFTAVTLPVSLSESSVAWGDYDGDNDLDLLVTGTSGGATAVLKNTNGVFSVVPLFLPGVMRGSAKWGDYDQDGDLDMVFVGQQSSSPWNLYVYKNNGSGFTQQFTSSDYMNFGDCEWGDFDNDGDLDIIATGYYLTFLFQNNGGVFSKIPTNFYGLNYASLNWVDYDNDKDLDLFMTGEFKLGTTIQKVSIFYRNNAPVANTIPQAPNNLQSIAQGDSIMFSWNPGTDAETNSIGLYYNIYLGSLSTTVDSLTPMADILTGKRRVERIGNTSSNKSWKIKNIATGTYYWSVQSIDNSFEGSVFAPQQIITIVTGDDDLENAINEDLVIYPNPANGDFKILYKGDSELVNVELLDIASKIVFSQSADKMTGGNVIEVKRNEVSVGLYTLKLTTATGVISKKVIFK